MSCKTYMLYNAYKAALPDWLRDRTAAYTFWSLLLLLLMLPLGAVALAVAVAFTFAVAVAVTDTFRMGGILLPILMVAWTL